MISTFLEVTGKPTLNGSTSHENEFIIRVLDLQLTQLVSGRTHANGNNLDFLQKFNTNCCETFFCVHSENFSDHFPVFIYTRIKIPKILQPLPTSNCYSRATLNWTVFKENLNLLYKFLSKCLTFPLNFVEMWYENLKKSWKNPSLANVEAVNYIRISSHLILSTKQTLKTLYKENWMKMECLLCSFPECLCFGKNPSSAESSSADVPSQRRK